MKNQEQEFIEGIVKEFEPILNLLLPGNVDVATLDGDSRTAKERARDFIRQKLSEAIQQGRKEAVEYIRKNATARISDYGEDNLTPKANLEITIETLEQASHSSEV